MQISLYPDFQKLQDQLHFDRNGNALWLIPTCLIGEPALLVFSVNSGHLGLGIGKVDGLGE